ncbi:TerC/Alx family metal homeostasis membrane protein [Pseudactinotalea sp. HY158]|uniref:TerC/Alx family metal homeostasis membrane protein n=1 Tax=Pseudactinotalea sp. HY158 TaxID=2654547 RepID=UPI00129CA2AB|nr:TerC/Alx family metal homeostasis membrane protein [Pseudactinotalea sp. HY158]QGH69933.1 TerC/Alx family metal homeostasis membrane protein [Pseudactinotalea sp. HY158]
MSTGLPPWFEIGSLIVLVAILIADLVVVTRRPHRPSAKECGIWVGVYVTLALVFAACILLLGSAEYASQFVAGWLTEYSLSIDNLFVFVLIMTRFAVPEHLQQEVLMAGILIALVLRGVFILIGAQLIASYSWIFYLFGAFLVFTAIHQVTGSEDEGGSDNALIRRLRSRLRMTDTYDGMRLRTMVDGQAMLTPLLLVLLALGTTDLLFALDSIPAVFGITNSAFIVFTANIFALMGLRQLYFLLGHLIERLIYLKYGIAAILGFIGVKLVFHAMHENSIPFLNGGQPIQWAPEIGTGLSLGVIIASMVVATLASLLRTDRSARDLGGPGRSA